MGNWIKIPASRIDAKLLIDCQRELEFMNKCLKESLNTRDLYVFETTYNIIVKIKRRLTYFQKKGKI